LNYMKIFADTCLETDFSVSCSRAALKTLDTKKAVLSTAVEECFIQSFQYDSSNKSKEDQYLTCEKNDILEADASKVETRIKNILPIIYVNDYSFYGSWTYENVLEAMCAILKDKPSSCYSNLPEYFIREDQTILGFNFSFLVFIVLMFVIVNILIVLYCRRMSARKIDNQISSKDINDKISDIVTKYIAMKDSN